MTDAALYVIGAAFTVAFASFISYNHEDKWQKFALGAILLSMLAGGAGELIGYDVGSLFTPSDSAESSGELRDSVAKESYEKGIARLVADSLRCSEDDVRVAALGFSFEKMSAEKISVYLYGKAAIGDYRGVRELLYESGFENCEVIISFEENSP